MPRSRVRALGLATRVVLAIAPSLSIPVHAQDWQRFASPSDAAGAAHYIDSASLTKNGQLRTAWTLVLPPEPVRFDNQALQSWVTLVEVNCVARTGRGLREIGYTPAGAQLYHARSGAPAQLVGPGSFEAARLQALCSLP